MGQGWSKIELTLIFTVRFRSICKEFCREILTKSARVKLLTFSDGPSCNYMELDEF